MTLALPAISAGAISICDDAIELRIIADRPRDAIDALIEMSQTTHLALRIFSRARSAPGASIDLDADPAPDTGGPVGDWDARTQMRISTAESTSCIYVVPLGDLSQTLGLSDVAIRTEALTRPEAIRLAFGLDVDQCPALGGRK